jgi:dTDP-glucose pyrophosphorylase
MPKQLIPVANKPVLEHVLGNVRLLGVTEAGIIVNRWAPEIVAQLGDGSRFGLRLKYIPQDKPRGLAHAVLIARDFIGIDDFVMYLGDNILADSITECHEEFAARRPAAHVVVTKVTDPRAFGVVEIDHDGTVLRLTEKPRYPRSDLALTGVYFFTSAIQRAVGAIRPSARGELEITDAIQWLLTEGEEVTASQYYGYFRDVGRVKDVLECNRRVLDGLRPGLSGEIDAGSTLTGPVAVEAGPGDRRRGQPGAGQPRRPAHLDRPGLRADPCSHRLFRRAGGRHDIGRPGHTRVHDRPSCDGRDGGSRHDRPVPGGRRRQQRHPGALSNTEHACVSCLTERTGGSPSWAWASSGRAWPRPLPTAAWTSWASMSIPA